jgi:hypothetical protein
MPTTYSYLVANLTKNPAGIVIGASFSITANDGTHSFKHNYHTGFANQPVTPIPFEDLTETKVIEWIKRDAGDDNQFEHQADAELEAYKLRLNQAPAVAPVPWG